MLRSDGDGVIYPWDTLVGFRRLGFNWIISLLAPVFIHGSFSYPTQARTRGRAARCALGPACGGARRPALTL